MSLFRKELSGINPYVPGKPIEEVKVEYNIEQIIKLASNENPLGASEYAISEMKKALEQVHLYPDPEARILKDALQKKYQIDSNNILVAGGGEELIRLIATTFINYGDEAIMATPSFSLYKISVNLMGGKSIEIPLKDFKHDLKAFNEVITEKTKMVFICNPNNPTGNISDTSSIKSFVENLREDIILVIDEAYYDYAIRNPHYLNGIDILRKRKNTIILRTLSKVAGLAALRIGYIFSSIEIIEQMSKIKKVFSVSNVGQIGAVASLSDVEHLEDTVDLNYESLDIISEFCRNRRLNHADYDSNFIFMDTAVCSKLVYEQLLKRGIVIRPGYLWGYDTYIRVSSSTIDNTRIFLDALEDILKGEKNEVCDYSR